MPADKEAWYRLVDAERAATHGTPERTPVRRVLCAVGIHAHGFVNCPLCGGRDWFMRMAADDRATVDRRAHQNAP